MSMTLIRLSYYPHRLLELSLLSSVRSFCLLSLFTAQLIPCSVAMLHYPGVMRTAQAELDAVVGPDRIPDWTDRPNLPYVRALIHETLRWRPVAALGGMAHASTKEDVYEGM